MSETTTARESAAEALERLRQQLGAAEPRPGETLSATAFRLAGEWERRWHHRCQSQGMFDNGSWTSDSFAPRPRPDAAKAMANPHLSQRVQFLLGAIKRGDACYANDLPAVMGRHWRDVADSASAAARHLEEWDEDERRG